MVPASSALLSALIESIADGLYIVDPRGDVEFVNRAGLEVLGYADEAELVGRPSHATIHAHHRDGTPYPESECPLLRPRLTGEAVREDDDWFVRKDGSMVPVAYSSAPFERPDGRAAVVVFRDTTELRRVVEARELEASRRRLVEAADAERRRLGRDLHDGAQQRLINVVMALQLDGVTGAALEEARAAIEDLREIAAGLHPAILTNKGLRAAIVARTAHVPLPVEIDVTSARLEPSVEAAAYFVIAEALANVVKHADASAAMVRAHAREGALHVEVTDDGRGGATPGGGSGLLGLADRVSALGGTLRVGDDTAGGTRLSAVLPLA